MLKKNQIPFYLLSTGVILSFAYILAVFPFCLDEWYMLKSNEEFGCLQTIKELFYITNSRLANISVTFLLELPRIFYISIEIIALIVGYFLMIRLAEIKVNQWVKISFFTFMFVFTPMWQQAIFSLDWAFNYIVPIPLLFGMIYITLQPEKYSLTGGIILGLILGAWHESYALLYLVGSFFVFLSNIHWANKKRIFWFIAVLLGFLWLFFNPGSWNRVGTYYLLNLKSFFRPLVAWPYFLYVFFWLITLFKKERRSIALNPILIFFLGGCSFIPFAVFFGREIAGMPAILAAICGLSILCPLYFEKINKNFKIVLSILLGGVTLVHLVAIDIETNKLCKIFDEVSITLNNAQKSDKYGFSSIYYSYEAPLITLRMPYNKLFDPDQGTIEAMAAYHDLSPDFNIVPEELKKYSSKVGQRVNHSNEINLFNGYIVSHNVNDSTLKTINVKYENLNKWWETEVIPTAFVADNGNEYVFIYPTRNLATRFLGKPVDIKLQK